MTTSAMLVLDILLVLSLLSIVTVADKKQCGGCRSSGDLGC
ncbi:MAG: hypothetical protein ABF297_18210 [Thiogranum sp.]